MMDMMSLSAENSAKVRLAYPTTSYPVLCRAHLKNVCIPRLLSAGSRRSCGTRRRRVSVVARSLPHKSTSIRATTARSSSISPTMSTAEKHLVEPFLPKSTRSISCAETQGTEEHPSPPLPVERPSPPRVASSATSVDNGGRRGSSSEHEASDDTRRPPPEGVAGVLAYRSRLQTGSSIVKFFGEQGLRPGVFLLLAEPPPTIAVTGSWADDETREPEVESATTAIEIPRAAVSKEDSMVGSTPDTLGVPMLGRPEGTEGSTSETAAAVAGSVGDVNAQNHGSTSSGGGGGDCRSVPGNRCSVRDGRMTTGHGQDDSSHHGNSDGSASGLWLFDDHSPLSSALDNRLWDAAPLRPASTMVVLRLMPARQAPIPSLCCGVCGVSLETSAIGTTRSKSYRVYHLVVANNTMVWYVRRRFSEFLTLHKALLGGNRGTRRDEGSGIPVGR